MTAAVELAPSVGVAPACAALSVSRATYYRHQRPATEPSPRPKPTRALADGERAAVLEVLHSERFCDRSPAEVVYTLAEEGEHLCSVRTMYRVLAANQEVRERRDQLRHPSYAKPELVATAPKQVWSWDITKLLGPVKWSYFYLYVIMDVFSRYVVGWMLAEHENAKLAQRLIEETVTKQEVEPGSLVLHADRGAPMKAKTTAQLLADLCVERSHSRPHVSDDNPYSESQFKTLKYYPGFPKRFGGLEDAMGFCRRFFPWYNDDHRHSALAYLTPRVVHYGQTEEALDRRHETMLAAYTAHPERYVHGPPRRPELPRAVWINPPRQEQIAGVGEPMATEPPAAMAVEDAREPSS
jgi:putative transposase